MIASASTTATRLADAALSYSNALLYLGALADGRPRDRGAAAAGAGRGIRSSRCGTTTPRRSSRFSCRARSSSSWKLRQGREADGAAAGQGAEGRFDPRLSRQLVSRRRLERHPRARHRRQRQRRAHRRDFFGAMAAALVGDCQARSPAPTTAPPSPPRETSSGTSATSPPSPTRPGWPRRPTASSWRPRFDAALMKGDHEATAKALRGFAERINAAPAAALKGLPGRWVGAMVAPARWPRRSSRAPSLSSRPR